MIVSCFPMEPQVSRSHYFKKKYADLERFISYFYQVDLVTKCMRDPRDTVLEIGVGNGTVADFLRKAGVALTTCDFDRRLNPDHVADVRTLPFADNSFDIVTAFEVLEHIPFEDFERAVRELRRVSRRCVILSLPYRSTGFELVLKFPYVRTIFRRLHLDLFLRIPLIFRRAGPRSQHHWEIDLLRYSRRRIRSIILRHFTMIREVRPVLHSYHHFFVVEK